MTRRRGRPPKARSARTATIPPVRRRGRPRRTVRPLALPRQTDLAARLAWTQSALHALAVRAHEFAERWEDLARWARQIADGHGWISAQRRYDDGGGPMARRVRPDGRIEAP
jgi:hypothetical protein